MLCAEEPRRSPSLPRGPLDSRPHRHELAGLGWLLQSLSWCQQPSVPPTGSAFWSLLLTSETSLEQFLGVLPQPGSPAPRVTSFC